MRIIRLGCVTVLIDGVCIPFLDERGEPYGTVEILHVRRQVSPSEVVGQLGGVGLNIGSI